MKKKTFAAEASPVTFRGPLTIRLFDDDACETCLIFSKMYVENTQIYCDIHLKYDYKNKCETAEASRDEVPEPRWGILSQTFTY